MEYYLALIKNEKTPFKKKENNSSDQPLPLDSKTWGVRPRQENFLKDPYVLFM